MRDEAHLLRADTYPHRRRLETVYGDTDMQRHVNNVAIARFFEEARSSLHREFHAVQPNAFKSMVLARVEIDYLREVAYPGPIDLAIGVGRIGTSSFEQIAALFQYGACAALSVATSVLRNGDRTQSQSLSTAERQALDRFAISLLTP